jgi:radical SAM protein with 4Fe4S-binding SPASM domain
METLGYSDWNLSVKQRLTGRRVPLAGTLELTRRCNQRCRHCYNNLPAADAAAKSQELGTGEVHRILDELAEAGCVWLLFTGGEILLRPDFTEIYTYAKEKGFLITLFSNGTIITAQLADELARCRPFSIEITLYGATPQTYERVTGIPGSFGRCLQGIGYLRERGLPLKLKSMVLTLNQPEVWDMKRFAEEELGLPFRFDAMLNPRCDCSQSPLAVRLSPEEVVALDLLDPERLDALRKFALRFSTARAIQSQPDDLYRCGGGVYSFAVDPYGRLRPCVLSPEEGFDLRGGSFNEGWDRFLSRMRQQKMDRRIKCAACVLKSMCGMCPANAALECGDPQQPVDFLCRVAHLRAYVLDMDLAWHGECEYCEGGVKHAEIIQSAARLKKKAMPNERCTEKVGTYLR